MSFADTSVKRDAMTHFFMRRSEDRALLKSFTCTNLGLELVLTFNPADAIIFDASRLSALLVLSQEVSNFSLKPISIDCYLSEVEYGNGTGT